MTPATAPSRVTIFDKIEWASNHRALGRSKGVTSGTAELLIEIRISGSSRVLTSSLTACSSDQGCGRLWEYGPAQRSRAPPRAPEGSRRTRVLRGTGPMICMGSCPAARATVDPFSRMRARPATFRARRASRRYAMSALPPLKSAPMRGQAPDDQIATACGHGSRRAFVHNVFT